MFDKTPTFDFQIDCLIQITTCYGVKIHTCYIDVFGETIFLPKATKSLRIFTIYTNNCNCIGIYNSALFKRLLD